MMEVPQEVIEHAEKVLKEGTDKEILAFFAFNKGEPRELIAFKFQYWVYKVFPRYIQSPTADFHTDFIFNMLKAYYGESNYLNLGFRGCAKTTYAKLFLVYVILNDMENTRKYIKVLTRNFGNAKQMVTDIFNMIVECKPMYGNVFHKAKDMKREETMAAFTTVDGVKLMAGTVGMTQRGHVQDAFRPDFMVFDDVEDRESIQSLTTTESTIWRIDEAIQGLASESGYMTLGNYISEEGVIQWFLNKPRMTVDRIAIQDEDGNPTWPDRYDKEKIQKIKDDADDFYGEYMADPSRADTAFFERSRVDADIQAAKQPTFESAGVKYWGEYQPHHRYGMGADTSEGIGKDANTFGLFDFGTHEGDIAVLTATYFNNRIPPDLFGHELMRVGREFGNCIIAPENNNTGHATIATMRGYPNIYAERKEGQRSLKVTQQLGWRTTKKSKPQMLFEFRRDYNDGLLKIYDINVLKEMRSFTTADLTDTKIGMVTRHFDLLMACFVAGTMVVTDKGQRPIEDIKVGDLVMTRKGLKPVTANIAHPKNVITNIGLTGTPDHPVFCNGTTKDLSQVSHGDILTIWNESKQAIENISYTTALNIIGTPAHRNETIGFISQVVQQIKSQLSTFIGLFGKMLMGLFQKTFVFIIRMVTHLITTLITWSVYLFQTTCEYTWKNLKERKRFAKLCLKIERQSMKVLDKVLSIVKNIHKFVSGVVNCLKLLLTMLASAVERVHTGLKEKEEKNRTKKKTVQFVGESIEPECHTKSTAVIHALPSVEKKETVYNLQVSECPEYFANNILVHNCVIAWQMRKYAQINYFDEEIDDDNDVLFDDIGI